MKKAFALLQLALPYKYLLLLLIILTALGSISELWIPRLIGKAIDEHINGGSFNKQIITELAYGISGILIFTYSRGVVQTYTAEVIAKKLRITLFRKISTLGNEFVENWSSVRLLSSITTDVDVIKNFISQTVITLISSLSMIIGATFIMISINPILCSIVWITIPIMGTFYLLVFGKIKVWSMKRKELVDQLNMVISENIHGAALIRTLNSKSEEEKKFELKNDQLNKTGISILNLMSLLIPLVRFTGNLTGLFVLIVGAYFVIYRNFTLGEFAAFNSYLGMIILPIFSLGMTGNLIVQASISYDRITTIIECKEDLVHVLDIPKNIESIQIKNLNLEYCGKKILQNINLDFSGFKRIALVGPTGAGKTQLLHLLTGMIKQYNNCVFYGTDNQKASENFEKGKIGIVFQESFLFNATLRENIIFGDECTSGNLNRAIRVADLENLIGTLPNGLNTKVTDFGSNFSGGEKQRIMLARALVIEPTILFLDDFISRLDLRTRNKILNNLEREFPDTIIIATAQRIGMFTDFDKLVFLSGGEVLGFGSHDNLMHTNEAYRILFNRHKSSEHLV